MGEVVVVSVGTIIRFDEVRGYGFIQPASGGEDVFVHANDFGDQRHLVRAGAKVSYEVIEGDRGLKVSSVTMLNPAPVRTLAAAEPAPARSRDERDDRDDRDDRGDRDDRDEDDDGCDVLSARDFRAELDDLLITQVPSLTGAQMGQIRQHVLELARAHGWVEG